MAMGLIVKLKDAKPQSVVRRAASRVPSENAQQLRLHMANVARRKRVSYLVHRPTAFAASVIHAGYPIPVAEARAQAARLRTDPDVEWVIVNEIERPAAVAAPNDPGYALQTWLGPVSGAAVASPDFPAAWDLLEGHTLASPVVVALLDSGVADHADLTGRVMFSGGYDFVSEVEYANDGSGQDSDAHDPGDGVTSADMLNTQLYASPCEAHYSSWHGTRIAGQLAAATDNGVGIAGILRPLAGEVVLPVRVGGKCGAAVSDIVEGMLWSAGIAYNGSPAANPTPARILNLSFGGDGACDAAAIAVTGSTAWLYDQTVTALRQKGALLVASAGNGDPHQPLNGYVTPTRPASCPHVLAVTAVNLQGFKATYANFIAHSAPHPGLATVGGDPYGPSDPGIYSIANTGLYGVGSDAYADDSGTSFAAPMVAGAAALMLAAQPTLSVDELIEGLTTGANVRAFPATASAVCSASNTGNCNCTTATCGAGILDAGKAVNWAINHGPGSYMSGASVSAPYFTPERLQSRTSSSGGGGGAAGWLDVLALALAALLALGARVKTGRP
jgi:serine protease